MVFALCLLQKIALRLSFPSATPRWASSRLACNDDILSMAFVWAALSPCKSPYCINGLGRVKMVAGLIPASISDGQRIFPSSLLPNLSQGDWLVICFMASTMGSQCTIGNFHSDNNSLLVRITSLHGRSTVPFSHGQYGVEMWWHTARLV